MEATERRVGIVVEVIYINKGAEIPSGIRIAKVVDGKLFVDEKSRAYPTNVCSKLRLGEVVSLTPTGEVDDILTYFEQIHSISELRELRSLIQKNLKQIEQNIEEERYLRILNGVKSCISYVDSATAERPPAVRIIK